MSGLLLVAEGRDFKTFKVKRIIENSPPTLAGLREGDVISLINNRPTSHLTLEEVRRMFKQKGHSYRLTIDRGGQPIQTKIKLKKLI